jgi:tetratricopeptide (TPR) repeat protein
MCSPRVIVTLVTLLVASGASARDQRREAERHKQSAYDAFERGRYEEAAQQFELSYRLKPDPRLLYNLGLAYFRLYEFSRKASDLAQARKSFRSFLELVPLPPRGRGRKKVATARRLAKRYLARIAALTPPAPEQPTPAAAPAALPPASGPAMPPLVPDRQPRQTPRSDRRGVVHWVLYGLAGAAGAAAAVTGGLALAADRESDDLAAMGDRAANSSAERSRALAIGTDVLIGTAVLSAAVGLVLHLRAGRR